MKSKILSCTVSSLLTILILISSVPCAECSEYTVDEVRSLVDGIVSYKLSGTGCGSVQEWINGPLTDGAGRDSEWYIISLSQNGSYEFSAYEKNLTEHLQDISGESASSKLKYALALSASGSSSTLINRYLDEATGQQGIMSWIYGLHVLNNDYTSSVHSTDEVINTLLSLQYPDGGWALFGDYGDIDVTAMTMNALAPHRGRADVQNALDRGISFLSERQQDDGGFTSFGTANPESAAQVLTALSALGIDCVSDDRFIKNGNTVIDGIAKYRNGNGAFRHTEDGTENETATVQALYSFISYIRMREGRSPLFVLDNRRPVAEAAPAETEAESISPGDNPVNSAENTEAVSSSPEASSLSVTVSDTQTEAASDSAVTFASTESVQTSASSSEVTVPALSSADVSELKSEPSDDIRPVQKNEKNYKSTAYIIILCAGGAACIILTLAGKRNRKNYIFVLMAIAAAAAVIRFTDFRSAEDYYSSDYTENLVSSGTVTLEIRCDTIAGKSEYAPENGVILDKTEFTIEEGYTVFDVLTDAARQNGIHMENKGGAGNAHGMAYIAGINYIYEFDFGDLSGWVYHVNEKSPSVGCGEYVLHDGDEIQWLYTCNLGKDLNEVYE